MPKHLTKTDRLKIEALFNKGCKQIEIAAQLGVARSTICRELKRGAYIGMTSELEPVTKYSADLAEMKYQANLRAKGAGLKIGNDIALSNYIEDKIINGKYSPEAVVGELWRTGKWGDFSVTLCTRTLYNYIDKGVFLNLTNKNLPVKGKRRRAYHKVKAVKRPPKGTSIEKRPEEIKTREEFGNWEMDTVVGPVKKSKNSLLVLSERKTRYERIFILRAHTMEEVVARINQLEERMGERFSAVFKTITVDNGSEFQDCKGIETSLNAGRRTKLYYCHPYSSYERGTNENINKMIRRWLPKGISFDDKTDDEIQAIEDWINDYPRGIFEYQTARERYLCELDKLWA